MDALFDVIEKYESLDFDFVMESIFDSDLQELLIDLNQQQLFQLGEDSEGRVLFSFSPLQPYAPFTIKVKQETGLPTDRLTLFQTGEFYGSFTVSYANGIFTFDADGQKEDQNLFNEFGIDVLGLNETSKEIAGDFIKDMIIFFIQNKL